MEFCENFYKNLPNNIMTVLSDLTEKYSESYEKTQLYVIDGYIISPNIENKGVETIENNFSYSDHQPVKIKIKLK